MRHILEGVHMLALPAMARVGWEAIAPGGEQYENCHDGEGWRSATRPSVTWRASRE